MHNGVDRRMGFSTVPAITLTSGLTQNCKKFSSDVVRPFDNNCFKTTNCNRDIDESLQKLAVSYQLDSINYPKIRIN